MRHWLIAVPFAVVMLAATQAAGQAKPKQAQPAAEPQSASGPAMQVHLVRSAEPGCEPHCSEWISAEGRIDATTPRQFRKALSKLGSKRPLIVIDSAGGTVDESLAIGRQIRAKGLDIAVGKTELVPCAGNDKACQSGSSPRMGKGFSGASKCASSCAFILAGGQRRIVGPTAVVGVHQITSFETRVKVLRTYRVETRREWGVPVQVSRTLVSEKRVAEKTTQTATTPATYRQIRSYFGEMGVGEGVMTALLATPSQKIHWFTRSELQATRLATDLTPPALMTRDIKPVAAQAEKRTETLATQTK